MVDGSQPTMCIKAKPLMLCSASHYDLRGVIQPVLTEDYMSSSENASSRAVLLCQSVKQKQFLGKMNGDTDSGEIISAIPAQFC